MKTKLSLILAATAFISTAAAGDFSLFVEEPQPEANALFLDNELQIDLFTSYGTSENPQWAVGVGANSFFATFAGVDLGLGTELAYHEGGDFSSATSVILRAPVESYSVAPYVYGGIGWPDVDSMHSDSLEYHLGVGVDYRVREAVSLFADWRYTFIDGASDSHGVRTGVRVAF